MALQKHLRKVLKVKKINYFLGRGRGLDYLKTTVFGCGVGTGEGDSDSINFLSLVGLPGFKIFT